MRKVKLQVQLSIDGFVAGPNGEMDWMTWNWNDKLKDYSATLNDPVDTMLLGRKMASDFMSHWEKVAANSADPDHAYGKKAMDTPKVVFTKTLTKSDLIASGWKNTELATGDLATEIKKLKSQKGRDIILYGGASFNSSMVRAGLIDEYHLFINPAIIGNGMPIFRDITEKTQLKLVKASPFECGIVVLHYEPK